MLVVQLNFKIHVLSNLTDSFHNSSPMIFFLSVSPDGKPDSVQTNLRPASFNQSDSDGVGVECNFKVPFWPKFRLRETQNLKLYLFQQFLITLP